MKKPTKEELAVAEAEIRHHNQNVARVISFIINQLLERANWHDDSKLSPPEKEAFAKATKKLSATKYGSAAYKKTLKDISEAVKTHYAQNRHHPEHFSIGIEGMNLLDILEMVCDWKAATLRMPDGEEDGLSLMKKSLLINKKRFKIDDQLYQILENTLVCVDVELEPHSRGK